MKKKLTDEEIKDKIDEAARKGRIEMAPQDKLERLEDLTYEFMDECVGYKECLITDLSLLSDFALDHAEVSSVVVKTGMKYGVDITDKLDHYIVDIVEYIMVKREENKSGIQ